MKSPARSPVTCAIIWSDVERHTQEGVGRALVELQTQSVVSHIELEEAVTGWERHLVDLGGVPGRHNHAARVGVSLQRVYHLLYLVYGAAVVVGP